MSARPPTPETRANRRAAILRRVTGAAVHDTYGTPAARPSRDLVRMRIARGYTPEEAARRPVALRCGKRAE